MKRQRLYRLIFSLSAVFFLGACSLKEYDPHGGVTAEDIFTTPEGYGQLINACYINLSRMLYGRENMILMTEGGTDLWITNGNGTGYRQFLKYLDLTSSIGGSKDIWNGCYDAINLCNAAIERAERAGFKTEEEKNAKVAEARFLRAFYYFHIVEQFGGVYLQTAETDAPKFILERSPVEAFYDVIIPDLQFAAQWLPVEQDDVGRAVRRGALGMLAKAALQRTAYGDVETYATIARDAAAELINNKAAYQAELYPTFAEVFDPANNKTNKESLIRVTFSTNSALFTNSNPNRLFTWISHASFKGVAGLIDPGKPTEVGYKSGAIMQPTKFLFTRFNEDMDARYDVTFKQAYRNNGSLYTWNEADQVKFLKDPSVIGRQVEVGDTSFAFSKKPILGQAILPYVAVTLNDVYDPDTDTVLVNLKSNPDRSSPFKTLFASFVKYDNPALTAANNKYMMADVIVMRFAEAYLIAAEAEILLNRPGEAVGYVNTLRERASLSPSDFVEGRMKTTAADMTIDFILDERARELCGEHTRWYDLKRTKTFEQRLGLGKANPDIRSFDPAVNYVRPIPITFLNSIDNRDEFGQNPGYL